MKLCLALLVAVFPLAAAEKPATTQDSKTLVAVQDKDKVKLGPKGDAWLEYQAAPGEFPRQNIK